MTQPNLFRLDAYGNLEPDICSNKHGGNKESIAANEKAAPHKEAERERIKTWLRVHGPGTLKEYAAAHDVDLHCVSGRFSEISRDGEIVRTGKRREGCSVWRVVEGKSC